MICQSYLELLICLKDSAILRDKKKWKGISKIKEKLISQLKFGFIKRVDKGEITTVKDLESWRFER